MWAGLLILSSTSVLCPTSLPPPLMLSSVEETGVVPSESIHIQSRKTKDFWRKLLCLQTRCFIGWVCPQWRISPHKIFTNGDRPLLSFILQQSEIMLQQYHSEFCLPMEPQMCPRLEFWIWQHIQMYIWFPPRDPNVEQQKISTGVWDLSIGFFLAIFLY